MLKILYICTHNRCRSILSEAITNHMAPGKLMARSAGSQPAGEVHPLSIKYLQQAGIATNGLRSQSWDDFAEFAPDVVITVCDSAAAEACPVWFEDGIQLHWGLSDPSKLVGSEAVLAGAFHATMAEISQRVEEILALDAAGLDQAKFTAALRNLADNS